MNWMQIKQDATESLRNPVGQIALIGGTLVMALGLAAFNSPVLADGCVAKPVINFNDIQNADIHAGGMPLTGSIVDVVATSRGGVARYMLAYEANIDGANFLRTVSLRPDSIEFCDTGKALRANVALTPDRLNDLHELTVGSAVNVSLSAGMGVYGPTEMSLTALSMWHAEQGDDRLSLKLFTVRDGVRVGAILDSDAAVKPVPLWEVARSADATNRAPVQI